LSRGPGWAARVDGAVDRVRRGARDRTGQTGRTLHPRTAGLVAAGTTRATAARAHHVALATGPAGRLRLHVGATPRGVHATRRRHVTWRGAATAARIARPTHRPRCRSPSSLAQARCQARGG